MDLLEDFCVAKLIFTPLRSPHHHHLLLLLLLLLEHLPSFPCFDTCRWYSSSQQKKIDLLHHHQGISLKAIQQNSSTPQALSSSRLPARRQRRCSFTSSPQPLATHAFPTTSNMHFVLLADTANIQLQSSAPSGLIESCHWDPTVWQAKMGVARESEQF